MLEQFPTAYIVAPVLALFGFLLRRLFVKLDQVMSEDEIRLLLKDKIEPLHILQEGTEGDIARIERKLDKILDLIINDRRK